jgi:hypothetical protein
MKVIDQKVTDKWALYNGDCVDVMRGIPDDSVHYSVFSPPFASLYTYSASPRDMGNVATHSEFYEQYRFAAAEMYRITKPGRLLSFHCMLLPTSKSRDGFIGLSDFRGELIRIHAECGWIHHSEVVIWKDPVTAMQRTKALGLLHKQIRKDSTMSRQGIPDYLITMRKPGSNDQPVAHTGEGDDIPVQMWQRYASPVWVTTSGVDDEGFAICEPDIDPGDTLQHRSAREHDDERHICPLQLEVIRRAIKLWSNHGDTVFSPFAGIGSELYTAIQMGRRAVGAELKRSYYEQACRNLAAASTESQMSLFAAVGA